MRAFALLALGLFGCSLPFGVRTPTTALPLAVHAVPWSAEKPSAPVKLVADLGADVVVFSDGAATVVSDGAIANVDRQVAAWTTATTIPAPDGSGLWIVGVDATGQVWRLRGRKSFEPISERYGLTGARVRELCGFGGRFVGFFLADGAAPLALADGVEVDRYSSAALGAMSGGSGTFAALIDGGVLAVDARTRKRHAYDLGGARAVAVDEQGALYVATTSAVYVARDDGTLFLKYASGALHGLVASHDKVWFGDGEELGMIDDAGVHRSHGAHLPADASLTGSPSGDVWALSRGELTRFAVGESPSTASRVRWEDGAQPVFGRACASCHSSVGSSGVDLSTADRWRSKRDLIRQRVLVDKDMPPSGHALTDADRDAVRRWLDSPTQ